MGKHRAFNADRFLDKFQGFEILLGGYMERWNGRLKGVPAQLDVSTFKKFLINGDGDGKAEIMESLYRAYDLCTERGHEDLIAACRDCQYKPDPVGDLPVECLSLKVLAENQEAFNLAYDRNTLWRAERFSLFRGKEARPIADAKTACVQFQARLAEVFKEDKNTDLVLVRHYHEGARTNFIVYHEKRTKSELIIEGTRTRPKVSPKLLRPAQQDFVSYNNETGDVEIEARFDHEESVLREHFAECCLGDPKFFEDAQAARRMDLDRIAAEDFSMPVDEDDTATITELHFGLRQKHGPSFVARSKNVMETLETNYMRRRLAHGSIRRVVFKITFPDDRRGKRIELSGTNRMRFKRVTHAEDVFRYLKRWGVLVA